MCMHFNDIITVTISQGRTNKLVDGCYSFWQGGLFPLIHAVLLEEGGWSFWSCDSHVTFYISKMISYGESIYLLSTYRRG